ncbi:transposase [Actinomadura madurae]|nr:transposase [Actinomadura madurae]URM99082.1 transposase [Actinomadura madurae]
MTMPSSVQLDADQVVIAVDPHKASWTAVAVDARMQLLGTVRVPVSKVGYRQMRRFAAAWPQATWAIEGARGLGAPLTARLTGDGITVVDVPAKLARRVRLLSSGHGRTTDEADALSVGVAAQSASELHVARLDEAVAALRALIEHREDLVRTRTQTINRLHTLLTKLVPAGLPRKLTADIAARALRGVRPQSVLGGTLRALSADLVTEIRRLDRRVSAVTEQISAAVADSGTTLTELHGIGELLTAKILARTAGVDRFRSAPPRSLPTAASRRWTPPPETSNGTGYRGPASQLNCALHIMAITQIRRQTAGRDFYQRKRAEGKSHKEALRSLKRRLCDVVYRTMIKDTDTSLLAAA